MNVSIRLTATRMMLAGAAALLMISCGGGQDTSPQADAPAPSIPFSDPQFAYLVAAGGDVSFLPESLALEVGDALADDDRIVVGLDSFADIQFGDRAVARIFGRGVASVSSRGGVSDRPVLQLNLDAGSAAVNVAYLVPGEVFRVRTPRALYRVTGTRFGLSTAEADELVVSEGSVQVLPPSLDLDGLLESLVAEDQSVRDALFTLADAAPSVDSGEAVQTDPEAMAAADSLAEHLAAKMELVDQAEDEDRPSLVSDLIVAIRETSDALGDIVVSMPVASEDLENKLALLDEMSLVPVPKDPQGLSLLESEEIANLVKFTIRTVPQSSDIFINDLWVGQSVYHGVLVASESLSIRVSKDGYRERTIQVDRARTEVLTVQLERLPPSISAESFVKAITADDLATVRTYVREGGSVNVRTEDNVPAVVLASGLVPVLRGQAVDLSYHREILETVVAAGANLEAPFLIEGNTFRVLHATVLAGVAGFDVEDLLSLFTRAGADIDGTIFLEGEELTPLAIAVRWALFTGETREDLLKVLLRSGANLDVAISYNDELLTLREIAARLMEGGEFEDPELIDLLRMAGVPS
jgi:CBS domain-containing protein